MTADSDFCPHCGVIYQDAAHAWCEQHPDRPAVSVCIICRALLCDECTVTVHGRRFCRAHCLVEVQQDWAEVYSSADVNDAQLVKSVLENAGFTVQTQNFQNASIVWSGGGDNAISRSNVGRLARVLVPIPEFLNAAQALQEWQSSAAAPDGRPDEQT